MDKQHIQASLVDFVLKKGHFPNSIYEFVQTLNISETEFYAYYSNLEEIETDIWLAGFEETKNRLVDTEVYPKYSAREKVLGFFYTWLEVLKDNRSFVLKSYQNKAFLDIRPYFLEKLKAEFYVWLEEVLLEGRETEEVVNRLIGNQVYPKAFWGLALAILKFWVKDSSQNFEKTDIFVEKSVNFAFDAIGKTFLDSAFDLGKFYFQSIFSK